MNRFRLWRTALTAVALSSLCAMVQAQDYPSGTVTITVGFPAGTPPEINARQLADYFVKVWKKPVLGRNSGQARRCRTHRGPGASSARRPTVLPLHFGAGGMASYKLLVKDLVRSGCRDVAPVSLVAFGAGGLVTNAHVPARNLDEFIAYAKANPGKLNYGSYGPD